MMRDIVSRRCAGAWLIGVTISVMSPACSPGSGPVGSSSSGPSGDRTAPVASPVVPGGGAGPTLTGTVSVTGAHEFTAPFTTHALIEVAGQLTPAAPKSTCADYARGSQVGAAGTSFEAPVLHTAGDENVYVRASMRGGYAGPGTYASPQTADLTGRAIIEFDNGVFDDFSSTHGTTVLTVRPDGSGSLIFSDWRTSEVRGGLPGVDITGTVDWLCHGP